MSDKKYGYNEIKKEMYGILPFFVDRFISFSSFTLFLLAPDSFIVG